MCLGFDRRTQSKAKQDEKEEIRYENEKFGSNSNNLFSLPLSQSKRTLQRSKKSIIVVWSVCLPLKVTRCPFYGFIFIALLLE